jgi:hypothetical protein
MAGDRRKAMKPFASVLVGTSLAAFLVVCDVSQDSADRGVAEVEWRAGAAAGASRLPEWHPPLHGLSTLPDGHPPVLPEGHPPLRDLGTNCPQSGVTPDWSREDDLGVMREAPEPVSI